MTKDLIRNYQIKDKKVVVVDVDGTNLNVMDTKAAIELANGKDLDLVLFVPASKTKNYSICKILDYSKFLFQQKKKEKLAKKNQVIIKSKEVKLKPQIGKNDLQWKANQANEWLKQDCQVKLKIMTFGRIATKTELIDQVYNDFFNLVQENGKVASPLTKLSPIMYQAIIIKK